MGYSRVSVSKQQIFSVTMKMLKGSPVEEESNTFAHYTFHSEYLVIHKAEEMHPEQFICSSFFPLNIKAIFF